MDRELSSSARLSGRLAEEVVEEAGGALKGSKPLNNVIAAARSRRGDGEVKGLRRLNIV